MLKTFGNGYNLVVCGILIFYSKRSLLDQGCGDTSLVGGNVRQAANASQVQVHLPGAAACCDACSANETEQ
jgi:hypothetical protein